MRQRLAQSGTLTDPRLTHGLRPRPPLRVVVARREREVIVDSWHLAALHWWWRCRQKISTKREAARRRRHVARYEHEARRIRRIHWFAWPIALFWLAVILWDLTLRP